ncbi:MAG TPA: UDP-2,3-diacylglucosamine diphosphatase [Xanthomonadales bacterium]|nr:UDP-2,3-diacylglucosamine diphosphatase [Xanthomonadales bacterium]
MTTLFISDLHLEDSRPQATSIVTRFLRGPAREAEALYILGDLFEFWIGDDQVSETARRVAQEIAAVRNQGVACYFLHGNRDFLLGSEYAAQAGLELLPETWVCTLYGTPTLLLHGDTLCTGDTAYQAFRQQVRSVSFRQQFLSQPLPQRLEMARNARDASKQHTSSVSMDIMDVDERAVIAAFEQHGVKRMIHGHTHRPAFHRHRLDDGADAERLVLSDWYSSGSYLRMAAEGYAQEPLS